MEINNYDEKRESSFDVRNELNQNNKKKKKGIDYNVVFILFGLVIGIVIAGSFGLNFFSNKNDNSSIFDDEKNILEINDRTWVAFEDPIVGISVISDKNCEECSPEEILKVIKISIPTLQINDVDFDSEEGEKLINTFAIKTIPAFVFDSKIKEANEYERIKEVLVENDGEHYLDSAMAGIPVGRFLSAPAVGIDDAFKGPEDAKVTIVEFSDFECPYCKEVQTMIKEVLTSYPDQIKLVYKHFPLTIHDNAQKAAEASQCAKDQGQFWEMHDLIFEDQSKVAVVDLKNSAKKLKLNITDFNECLDSGKYTQKVSDDLETGLSYGINGTPAFFINNQFLSEVRSIDDFKNIIDSELSK